MSVDLRCHSPDSEPQPDAAGGFPTGWDGFPCADPPVLIDFNGSAVVDIQSWSFMWVSIHEPKPGRIPCVQYLQIRDLGFPFPDSNRSQTRDGVNAPGKRDSSFRSSNIVAEATGIPPVP